MTNRYYPTIDADTLLPTFASDSGAIGGKAPALFGNFSPGSTGGDN